MEVIIANFSSTSFFIRTTKFTNSMLVSSDFDCFYLRSFIYICSFFSFSSANGYYLHPSYYGSIITIRTTIPVPLLSSLYEGSLVITTVTQERDTVTSYCFAFAGGSSWFSMKVPTPPSDPQWPVPPINQSAPIIRVNSQSALSIPFRRTYEVVGAGAGGYRCAVQRSCSEARREKADCQWSVAKQAIITAPFPYSSGAQIRLAHRLSVIHKIP